MNRVIIDRGEGLGEASPLCDDEVLAHLPLLDLPAGATLNPDGSVTLSLDFPIALRTRVAGTEVVHEEKIAELVMHRMNGADMRRVIAAKRNMAQVALSRSTRLAPARMALISARLDASDLTAANAVVAELGGFGGDDRLPEHAVQEDGRITLPLHFPCEPEGFEPRHELVFHRLVGADLVSIQQARETLPAALARATRIPPKEADAIFDAMDAADVMAANRVIGFLSGNGRRTGR